MSTRKMTPVESKLFALSESLLDDIDDIGRDVDYSPEFHVTVRDTFGDDFHEIYLEWVAEGQADGVPQ